MVITIACVCDESSAVGGKLLQLQIHLCLSKSITKYYLEVTLCTTLVVGNTLNREKISC